MKQSVKRFTSSLGAFLLLLAAFVVFTSFVRPLYAQIASVQSEEFARRKFLSDQQSVVTEVKKLIASFAEAEKLQEGIAHALPLGPQVAEALVQVNGLSEINNLKPRSFGVTIAPPDARAAAAAKATDSLVKPFSSVSFHVELTGSYEDFKAFMKNLETNIRISLPSPSSRITKLHNQKIYGNRHRRRKE